MKYRLSSYEDDRIKIEINQDEDVNWLSVEFKTDTNIKNSIEYALSNYAMLCRELDTLEKE